MPKNTKGMIGKYWESSNIEGTKSKNAKVSFSSFLPNPNAASWPFYSLFSQSQSGMVLWRVKLYLLMSRMPWVQEWNLKGPLLSSKWCIPEMLPFVAAGPLRADPWLLLRHACWAPCSSHNTFACGSATADGEAAAGDAGADWLPHDLQKDWQMRNDYCDGYNKIRKDYPI